MGEPGQTKLDAWMLCIGAMAGGEPKRADGNGKSEAKGKEKVSESCLGCFICEGKHFTRDCPLRAQFSATSVEKDGEGSAYVNPIRSSKGKSAAQIADEHGLDEGLSKPRQEDRLTRIGAIAEFGSVDRGSLHADANSAAQRLTARICEFGSALAACPQMQIRQRATTCASQGLDLARSKTWAKDCPRHG
ncbi:hypothetical protein BDE02_14G002400 [Populus trichocarpa]|nr:hypothetical protein BDE02_14G002400 [Populus trichocarpa]